MNTNQKISVIIFSSVQAIDIARAIQEELHHDCKSTVWSQNVFEPGLLTLESLVEAINRHDFAVVVLHTDDMTIDRRPNIDFSDPDIDDIKVNAIPSPRDNVIFELGLGIGLLGRERVYAIYNGTPKPKIPTDLLGFNMFSYYITGTEVTVSTVGSPCNWIRQGLQKYGKRIITPNFKSLSDIADPNLQAFGREIISSAAAAVESITYCTSNTETEEDYYTRLIGSIRGLKNGDVLYAICGGKNYELDAVYNYLNENVRLAKDEQVEVYRLYIENKGMFTDKEWEVIDAHLTWAHNIPSFNIGVLVDEEHLTALRKLHLPHRFGMVLLRQDGLWSSVIHYGTEEQCQEGWRFDNKGILAKQKEIVEELIRQSTKVGITTAVKKKMDSVIGALKSKEKRLKRWKPEDVKAVK